MSDKNPGTLDDIVALFDLVGSEMPVWGAVIIVTADPEHMDENSTGLFSNYLTRGNPTRTDMIGTLEEWKFDLLSDEREGT